MTGRWERQRRESKRKAPTAGSTGSRPAARRLPHASQLTGGEGKTMDDTVPRTVWVVSTHVPLLRADLQHGILWVPKRRAAVTGERSRQSPRSPEPSPGAQPLQLWKPVASERRALHCGSQRSPRVGDPSQALGLLPVAGNHTALKCFRGCLAARTSLYTVTLGHKPELFFYFNFFRLSLSFFSWLLFIYLFIYSIYFY